MLCAIYKTHKKDGMYLYVKKRDQFDEVPEALLEHFGKPIFVMLFNLSGEKALAQCDKKIVEQQLEETGFYLHYPPKSENLFEEWVAQNKKQKIKND